MPGMESIKKSKKKKVDNNAIKKIFETEFYFNSFCVNASMMHALLET